MKNAAAPSSHSAACLFSLAAILALSIQTPIAAASPADPAAPSNARIQLLLDREDIDQLVTRFYQVVDARDVARIAEFVLPDQVDPMSRKLSPMLQWQVTQHVITDREIEVTGDTAIMKANLIGTSMGPQLPGRASGDFDAAGRDHYEVRGRYLCRFARTKEGWRIASIDIQYLWTNGAPVVTKR